MPQAGGQDNIENRERSRSFSGLSTVTQTSPFDEAHEPVSPAAGGAGRPAPVRPRRAGQEEKRRRIVEAARLIFTTVGYDSASMNDIASAARVSKPTLYVYFEHKEALFAALVDDLCNRVPECGTPLDAEGEIADLRAYLVNYARLLMLKLTRPEHIAFLRMVIGAASKFPELGRMTYEAGPAVGQARLARLFERETQRGRLKVDDTTFAAQQFFAVTQGGALRKALFNVGTVPTEAEIRACVEPGVDMFLAVYGVAAAPDL